MTDLKPIEQKEIQFQGEALTAVLVQDIDGRENIYVPLRPLVEGMGLTWSSQYRRVKRNPVLNEVCISVAVTATETGRGKGAKQTLSIPISYLNGFLFGIDANRVKDEIRPLIIHYQRECYRVLFEAFNGIESMTRFYRAVGHDERWINSRISKHVGSTKLSDVWLINGVPIEYHPQLQDQLSSGAFGITTNEHRKLKQLPDEANLQDNMSLVELAISLLADEAAREIVENEGATGLDEHTAVTKRAGNFAGKTRENFEKETGSKVLTAQNNLDRGKRPFLKNK